MRMARRARTSLNGRYVGFMNNMPVDEAHRAAADIFGDLLEGIGCGDPGGHDETAGSGHLTQRQQQLWEPPPQRPAEGPVIRGDELVLHGLEHLTHGPRGRPAPDAG